MRKTYKTYNLKPFPLVFFICFLSPPLPVSFFGGGGGRVVY